MSMSDDMESGSWFTLNFADGSTMELSDKTTTLCTFAGRNSMYDHVYVDMDPEDELAEAHYIFRGNPSFDLLQHLVLTYGFPQILDAPEVPDCDRRAFDEMQLADIEAHFGEIAG